MFDVLTTVHYFHAVVCVPLLHHCHDHSIFRLPARVRAGNGADRWAATSAGSAGI